MSTQTQPSVWRYYQDIQLDETKLGLCEDKEPPNVKLILGRAGTGKSHSIKKKALLDPTYAILSAPTGIAAINLDSITINSLLKYFTTKTLHESYLKGRLHELIYWIAKKHRNIVIDEVSMLDAKQLDIIIECMSDVNNNLNRNEQRVGLILTGDFGQLMPVNADFIFTGNSWKFIKSNIERLAKVYRQDDIIFLNALERCRMGDGYNTYEILKTLDIDFHQKIDEDFDGTTIFGTNDQIDFFNKKRFDAINEKIIRVSPTRRGILRKEWEFKVELQNGKMISKGSIPLEMQFKRTALIMLLTNDVPGFRYVNGDLAYIIEYKKPGLKIDDDYFVVKLKRNDEIINIPRITRLNYTDKEPDQKLFSSMFHPYVDHLTHEWVIGSISYHPLRLAYASTVHKCIDSNSLVLSETGLKPMYQIKVGENLITEEGHVEVLAKEKTYQSVIGIQTDYGQKINCSPDHRFPVFNKYGHFQELKEARDLDIGDNLKVPYNTKGHLFEYLITEDVAWLIGVIIGDGCCTNKRDGTIEIASRDEEIWYRVRKLVERLGINFHIRKDKKGIYFISKAFRHFLYELGLEYSIAANKLIPKAILKSQIPARAAFLAGLFDTDGHIACSKQRSNIVLSCTSNVLARQVQLLLLSIGIVSSIGEYKGNYKTLNTYSQVKIPRAFHKDFWKLIRLTVEYKQRALETIAKKPVKSQCDKRFKRGITSIKSISKSDMEIPMIDILVSGDNNLFITEGILTHNSQGLSLDRVQIDIRSYNFSYPHMIYVALSRAKSPEGLRIIGKKEDFIRKIKIDPRVREWI